MRYAMVEENSGIVVNVIEWDGGSNWAPPPGHVMVEDSQGNAGPGYSYDGEKFVPPPGGVPAT